jgi:quinol monooxygenase YgiN
LRSTRSFLGRSPKRASRFFRLHEDLENPGHFVLYVHFDSQAGLDSHFASSHFKKVVDAVAPLVGDGKPDITSSSN